MTRGRTGGFILRFWAVMGMVITTLSACGGKQSVEVETQVDFHNTQGTRPGSWRTFRGDPGLSGMTDSDIPDELSVIWSYATEGEIRSAAVLENDMVLFGSLDGKVYALDARDGTREWIYHTESPIEAPPMIHDGIVYIGSIEGALFSLDLNTGNKVWSYPTEGRIAGSANVYPSGDETIVVIGSYDSRLHGISAVSGKAVWQVETGYFLNGAPAISESTAVFGGCDAFLHIVSLDDGEKRGEVDTGAYVAGSPILAGGSAYACNYADTVLKIDVDEQKIVWTFNTGDEANAFYSSPALSGASLIVGGRDGGVYCLSSATGELVWRFMTGGAVDSSPVIAGKKVISASADGFVYLIDLATGNLLGSLDLGSSISASPAVSNGKIYIGTQDGLFYALGGRR